MRSQEDKWFKRYTWHHEVGTTEVVIEMQKGIGKHIEKMVKDYLSSVGFTDISDSSNRPAEGFHVDLVNRKFRKVSSWEISCLPSNPPVAWPSQIPPFIEEKKAQLTGARFGV